MPQTTEMTSLLGLPLWDYLVPALIIVAAFVLGLLARRLLFQRLLAWARTTPWQVDNIIIESTRGPSLIWAVMVGIYLALEVSPLPAHVVGLSSKMLIVLAILSVTIAAANILGEVIRRSAGPVGAALPTTTLTQTIARLSVIVVGALVILSTLQVNITPVLTALGVGGLAVALALQDTLANLFAGFYVSLARQIHIGNRIRLDSGEEGYVTDIGWRSTTLRTPSNHLIIVPNAKLAQSIITNYNMPDPPVNIVIPVGVSYDSDPAHVEGVLKDVAKQAIDELPGFVREFEPIVRFQQFADFSLNFLLIVRVENYDAQFAVWGELHKRIFNRLKQEGIEIPFPVRTVYLRGNDRVHSQLPR